MQEFASSSELWQQEAGDESKRGEWYQKSVEYWDRQEASYNGVLGGYGYVSDVDVRDSRALLKKACARRFGWHGCVVLWAEGS